MTPAGRTIVLVRHGPSALGAPPGRLTRSQLLDWRVRYDAAGLRPDAAPPASLARLAAGARVVSSDLSRAVQSAALLSGSDCEPSPLLREVDLPIPAWLPMGLPAIVWATFIHLEWVWANIMERHPPEDHLRQARAAAEWLGARTGDHPVVAVTHGVIRRLVAIELQRAGWRRSGWWRSYAHWSAWLLHDPVPRGAEPHRDSRGRQE